MKITHLAVLALLPLAACASNPPPPPPPMAAALPAASAQDQSFAAMAAESDMFEIQSSQLALQKSRSARVRAYAQHMIDDHTQTTQQLTALASQKNMTPPASLPADMQAKLDALQGAGRGFDRQYMADQVSGHQMAAQNLQTEISSGTDPDLKSFAQTTLPAVEDHLKMAEQQAGSPARARRARG